LPGPFRVTMAAVNTQLDRTEEYCAECDRVTVHRVRIRVESTGSDGTPGAKFSRHPFRVASCRACGTECRRRAGEA
jgi:hypothetical protein